MTTRMAYYSAQFVTAQDEVIWRKSLDTSYVNEEFGDCDSYYFHAALLRDLFGADWIVITEESGAVDVTRYPRLRVYVDGQLRADTRNPECESMWDRLIARYESWIDENGEDE